MNLIFNYEFNFPVAIVEIHSETKNDPVTSRLQELTRNDRGNHIAITELITIFENKKNCEDGVIHVGIGHMKLLAQY